MEKISTKEKKHIHKEKKLKERKHSFESEECTDNQNLDNGKDKANGVNDGYRNARKEGRNA